MALNERILVIETANRYSVLHDVTLWKYRVFLDNWSVWCCNWLASLHNDETGTDQIQTQREVNLSCRTVMPASNNNNNWRHCTVLSRVATSKTWKCWYICIQSSQRSVWEFSLSKTIPAPQIINLTSRKTLALALYNINILTSLVLMLIWLSVVKIFI